MRSHIYRGAEKHFGKKIEATVNADPKDRRRARITVGDTCRRIRRSAAPRDGDQLRT
jgi:hypothetical protein